MGGEWKGSFLGKYARFAGAGPAAAPARIVLLAWLSWGSVRPAAVLASRNTVVEDFVRCAEKGLDIKGRRFILLDKIEQTTIPVCN